MVIEFTAWHTKSWEKWWRKWEARWSRLDTSGANLCSIFIRLQVGTGKLWLMVSSFLTDDIKWVLKYVFYKIGCASQGITFATAYDSLGEEGVRVSSVFRRLSSILIQNKPNIQLEHSITQPSVYGLFTNASLLHTVASVISRTPSLKVLIYDGPSSDIKKDALEVIKKANGGSVKVYTWDQFVELGAENVREPVKGKPEDVVTLMYTSGSSGAPKVINCVPQLATWCWFPLRKHQGVLLTNANIVASGMQIFSQWLEHLGHLQPHLLILRTL